MELTSVSVDTLKLWSESLDSFPQLLPPSVPTRGRKDSPFPCRQDLNEKIVLWKGHIWELEVDAIAVSNNETFSSHSGIISYIHRVAGGKLEEECMTLEKCRTGDARVTSGYNLPSRLVIHAVAPRFAEEYRLAAGNALNSCFRFSLQRAVEMGLKTIAIPPISIGRQKFPYDDAAHIFFRTIRRFLELHPSSVDRVVICVDDDSMYGGDIVETETFWEKASSILPMYFPRSEEEEKIARALLPEDVGNKSGETVVEERKIRISAFPGAGRKKRR